MSDSTFRWDRLTVTAANCLLRDGDRARIGLVGDAVLLVLELAAVAWAVGRGTATVSAPTR